MRTTSPVHTYRDPIYMDTYTALKRTVGEAGVENVGRHLLEIKGAAVAVPLPGVQCRPPVFVVYFLVCLLGGGVREYKASCVVVCLHNTRKYSNRALALYIYIHNTPSKPKQQLTGYSPGPQAGSGPRSAGAPRPRPVWLVELSFVFVFVFV